jgi:6-phosphogluconolactonase
LPFRIQVVDSLAQLARESISHLHGPNIAVSGGSTFAKLFPYWVESVASRLQSGESLQFLPVDERQVAYDAPGCNWKICVDSFLAPAGLGTQKSHYVSTLSEFEQLTSRLLPPSMQLDTVMLGMGDDGHTASLFPGEAHLQDSASFVLETRSPKPPFPRLTLGLRAIWRAKNLVAIVTGPDKAEMVRRLVEKDHKLPITLALNGHPNPILLVDAAAASKL